MPKSVEALKELIEDEKKLKIKYESAVNLMGHDSSKIKLNDMIAGKQTAIEYLEKTLSNAGMCPHINPDASPSSCSC